MSRTVSVPPELEPLFADAQEQVSAYFRTLHADPGHGTLTIGGQRYILVRAASMSVEFFATIMHLYGDKGETVARGVARSLLYDIAYALGAADARAFHHDYDLHDPIARLSAGPVHFAHAGWAYVSILPESNPAADQSFRLFYDHPYSFEADAWLTTEQKVDFPVCIMNAGYSAGWCTESFGLSLVAVEISCKGKGDDVCRFVMAPPDTIGDVIADYLHDRPEYAVRSHTYEIPDFFSRKRAEDELRERETQYRSIFESVTDATLIVQLDGCIAAANPAAERMYGWDRDQLHGMHIREITASSGRDLLDAERVGAFIAGTVTGETLAVDATGHVFEVEFHATAFGYRRQPHILVLVNDISKRKHAEAERLRLQEQLLRQNERLREELSLARTVQRGLLLQRPPWDDKRLAVAHRSLAAGEVTRDFHVFVDAGHDRMVVVLGNVAGKGVAAALVMALAISAIETQASTTPEPAALLAALEARLHDQLQACETSISLLATLVDLPQRRLQYANVGMPPPVLIRVGHTAMLDGTGVPLGIVAQTHYEDHRVDLLDGDRIVMLSDGTIEARNVYRELFGYERLLGILDSQRTFGTVAALLDEAMTNVQTFIRGAEQHDDMTMLALEPFLART